MDAPIAANAAENVRGVEAEAVITSRGTKSNAKLLAVFSTLNAKGMAAGFVAKTDKSAQKGRSPTLQRLHDLLSASAADVSSPFHGGKVPNADPTLLKWIDDAMEKRRKEEQEENNTGFGDRQGAPTRNDRDQDELDLEIDNFREAVKIAKAAQKDATEQSRMQKERLEEAGTACEQEAMQRYAEKRAAGTRGKAKRKRSNEDYLQLLGTPPPKIPSSDSSADTTPEGGNRVPSLFSALSQFADAQSTAAAASLKSAETQQEMMRQMMQQSSAQTAMMGNLMNALLQQMNKPT
jgi:hypothetical protein